MSPRAQRAASPVLAGAAAVMALAISSRAAAADAPVGAAALTEQQAMLWKYTARCALRADQVLERAVGDAGRIERFPGLLGLAPEWREGGCDGACQEKVSACLAALTNQTGMHVNVSMLSAAPSLKAMSASEDDRAYPFQEGAFFGNVFAGEAYVCHGRDAAKGIQVKRFCAFAPALCTSSLATFTDAGACEDRCEMACSTLSDGTDRCAAVSCRDPQGRVWAHPITTYLRNRIEAGNADSVTGAVVRDSGLEAFGRAARATYRAVDFGPTPGTTRALRARVTARAPGGRIEVWLDGKRVGARAVPATGRGARDLIIRLAVPAATGARDLVLRFAGLPAGTRVSEIGLDQSTSSASPLAVSTAAF